VSGDAARAWLAARVAAAPPALCEQMDAALSGLPDSRAALDAGPGRAAALPLLAADALLTHGCEAAAEAAGEDGVAAFAASWGAARLGMLLEVDVPDA
jgi:hypothetical protein